MKCLSPIKIGEHFFNCGHCINCRINYTQMWSLRLIYELSTVDSASFLTLTYNNENLPKDFGLNKKDLTDFWKRLRINLFREYKEFAPKIKYYACGEYGDTEKVYLSPGAKKMHGRPHFHAIVFGLDDMNDKQREIVAKSWNKCDYWLFDKSRGRDSAMQEVTPDDINYVTGYVQKKLSGELGKETYGECQPPFSVCSQGLGIEFAEKNRERLLNNGFTFFKGHKVGVPRYFCEKFGVKKSELLSDGVSQIDTDVSELFELFKKDMQDKSTWYPENLTMLQHRFELWYSRREFEYSKRIYEDFKQRRKLKGAKL